MKPVDEIPFKGHGAADGGAYTSASGGLGGVQGGRGPAVYEPMLENDLAGF
mgnify:FL=1